MQCYLGGLFLLLSAWIRYAGTIHGLSKESSYALLMVGQVCLYLPTTRVYLAQVVRLPTSQLLAASAQPIWQVLGPMYSERWFDLKGRTTATMLIAVCKFCILTSSIMLILYGFQLRSQSNRRCYRSDHSTCPNKYENFCMQCAQV